MNFFISLIGSPKRFRAPEICQQTTAGLKDGKVRSDMFYPAGFMDVVQIEKTKELLHLDDGSPNLDLG